MRRRPGDRRAGMLPARGSTATARDAPGPRRGRTGRDGRGGIPGRGPAGTGRTGPARGADPGGGRPGRGGTGAGDSTGGGARAGSAAGNRRGERKSCSIMAPRLPPERPPPPREFRHIRVLVFFPICIPGRSPAPRGRPTRKGLVPQLRQPRAKRSSVTTRGSPRPLDSRCPKQCESLGQRCHNFAKPAKDEVSSPHACLRRVPIPCPAPWERNHAWCHNFATHGKNEVVSPHIQQPSMLPVSLPRLLAITSGATTSPTTAKTKLWHQRDTRWDSTAPEAQPAGPSLKFPPGQNT